MPNDKGEKRSAEEGDEPTTKKRYLFNEENSDTKIQGAGFKDKEKAEETLRLLDGRDVTYQHQVINTMFHRAKVILKRTKDPEKVKNMEEAIATFEKWLEDYRINNRAKDNYTYLPLDVLTSYKPLADHYGIKSSSSEAKKTFLEVYKEAEGDQKKLRVNPIAEDGITWDIHRNNVIKSKMASMKENSPPLFHTEGALLGLPTKDHVEVIVWAYSPDASRVKKAASSIGEKLGKVKNGE